MKGDQTSDLVRNRLTQAHTSLDDAVFLFEGNRSPESIVNRAYYAMFYAALALLQKAGKIPTKHAGVISLFDTEFVLKGILPKKGSAVRRNGKNAPRESRPLGLLYAGRSLFKRPRRRILRSGLSGSRTTSARSES